VLYVKRWLVAPLVLPDGSVQQRDRGTPQGSSISPVLANLFLHYAFDAWMARTFPAVPFERYCDDAVVHCVSQRQARYVAEAIANRMVEVGLRLHPDKTRIVYNQDANRRGRYEHTAFTFLGFTFRARPARGRNGEIFASFQPAISTQALNRISGEVRRWRLHRWLGRMMGEIAREINSIVRGWMQYYGAFYRSGVYPVLQRVNAYLMRWIRDKYKRLRSMKKAMAAWQRVTSQYPRLFAHWAWASQSWWSG
jgi:RNA-directed DNA polymerase